MAQKITISIFFLITFFSNFVFPQQKEEADNLVQEGVVFQDVNKKTGKNNFSVAELMLALSSAADNNSTNTALEYHI